MAYNADDVVWVYDNSNSEVFEAVVLCFFEKANAYKVINGGLDVSYVSCDNVYQTEEQAVMRLMREESNG